MRAVYREMCPNCGDRISDERLVKKNPCERCLESEVHAHPYFDLLKAVREALAVKGTLKEWEKLYTIENQLAEVERFFIKATGNNFWSAQRTWVRRLLKGKSFSIIAPTGMGKSIFGSFMAYYYALDGKKSYIVLPTTPLVKQTVKRLQAFMERAGKEVRLAYFYSGMRKKEKEEMNARIDSGDFDILVTSAQFLARKFERLEGFKFDYIFVDDVDAFLKASKNIDRSLLLLGFTQEALDKAWELVRLRKNLGKLLKGRRTEEKEAELKRINEEIAMKEAELREYMAKEKIGTLVIASATGSARGNRIKLYRELLGFEVGSGRSALRNVEDVYLFPKKSVEEHVEALLEKLGPGGLVFVPIDQGIAFAEALTARLKERGFSVELVSARSKKGLEKFENGEVDILIGMASYYGSLVRGLDMPERVRYALFTGLPKFRFSLDLEQPTIYRILGLISEIFDFLDEEDRREGERIYARLRRLIRTMPQYELAKIEEALAEGLPLEGYHNHVLDVFRTTVEFLKRVLRKEEVVKRIEEDPFISLKREGDKLFIEIPDVRTYIQASGRTSRLFAGGITKGLALTIVDNVKVFNGMRRQLRWRFPEFEWKSLEEIDIDAVLKEIDEDREKVRLVLEGKLRLEKPDLVKSSLLIVESPNKARTIANFFGQPSRRRIGDLVAYEVSIGDRMLTILASGGHMFDLVTDEGYHGVEIRENNGKLFFLPIYDTIKRCRDCGHQFVDWEERGVCPRCGSKNVRDALENVKAMRELAQEVDEILIATDPDTEGEKIAWDIRNVLAPYTPSIKRIEFHEVTRPAILKAIAEARDVNEARVEAQMVRRIADRWIGFELSTLLQKVFENYNLSAGRVQTPVLGWIIDRYRKFNEEKSDFTLLTLENDLSVFIEDAKLEDVREVEIAAVEVEEREINPFPPYTTDAMLQDASRFLKFSAPQTMRLAQDLFEAGLITYMRTDSTHVSNTGIGIAKEYILDEVGESYFRPRSWGEEGTHEAIRPTRPIDTGRLLQLIKDGIIIPSKPLTSGHFRLYDLIFRRFIASQMAPAKVLYQKATVKVEGREVNVEGYVDVLFDGWSKIKPLPLWKVPRLEEGARLSVKETKTWRAPKVQLYTQGDIIALMKERGIGRPSTYAKIVQTLLSRYYVIETRGKKRLVPTEQGIKVYHYLLSRFKELVSEEKTRQLEEIMDKIEEGSVDYMDVLNDTYREIKMYLS